MPLHALCSGRLGLPLAAVSAMVVAAAAGGARAFPPATADRVRLEVAGVLPAPDGGAAILVLREEGTETILPLVVPDVDGQDLGRRLAARRAPGVLGEAIAALGAKVREVEIETPDDGGAGARIRITQGRRDVELEARPSESVQLAVAAGAPIVAARSLLDVAGLTSEDLARARDALATGKARPLSL